MPLQSSLNAPCHAMRIRVAVFSDRKDMPNRLLALCRDWPLPSSRAPRSWVEQVPALSASELASRRREAEMSRSLLQSDGPLLRCVMLCYTDRKADLVLVAHRKLLDRFELLHVADVLLGRTFEPLVLSVSTSDWSCPEDRETAISQPPDWGLGSPTAPSSPATLRVALNLTTTDPESWKRALDLTLRRYDGQDQARVPDPVSLSFPLSVKEWPAKRTYPNEYLPSLHPTEPMTISVRHEDDGSAFLLVGYDRRVISPAIAKQFTQHLIEAHSQLGPDAEPDLFQDLDRDLIVALGRGEERTAQPELIHEMFRRRARAAPDAIAVSQGEQQLNYAELDRQSDRVAEGLRALGIGIGDRVGVCLSRTPALVVALLGTLKAGGVYVPMDNTHPDDRLAYIERDAGVRVVIADPSAFPTSEQVRTVSVETLMKLDSGGADSRRTLPVTPDSPAYVIYTSGSTGRPKGVLVAHRNVSALIDATREEYELEPDDVWTLFHSTAFDFSVWEIWGCLLTGGKLVVVPHWVARSPEEFRDLLVEERVSVLSQTPSAFGALLEAALRGPKTLTVRLLVFGGEPLNARLLLPWFDRHPESSCRVVNMYGITETTVHVTAQTITREHALFASKSVGKALACWQIYVLSPTRSLLPPAAVGEIYVGGAGVSLGYLDRPELTEDRFLADPFSGGTMYRTGDKGRLLPDGRLEHLGRLDNQVKLRGFRIELDEIKSVLLDDPSVLTAAVVSHHDEADAAAGRIDAYLVLVAGSVGEVRRRVTRVLPDYMLPSTFTELAALPLTPNGKLDETKLPAAAPPLATDEPPTVSPHHHFARELLTACSNVLGAAVGPDDDFFELGGNSLLAIRIATEVRERTGISLSIRELYLHPTVRGLSLSMGYPFS